MTTPPPPLDPVDVAAAFPDPPQRSGGGDTGPDVGDAAADVLVRPDAHAESPVEVVLSAEQLSAGTEWTVTGGVRFRRRIATYTRTVDVVVRREELEIEVRDVTERQGAWLGTDYRGPSTPAPQAPAGPGVFVLREEVPDVVLTVHPYERVTVHVDRVTEQVELHDTRRSERAMITGSTGTRHPPVQHDRAGPTR